MDTMLGEIILRGTNKKYHNETVTVQKHAITSLDVVDYIFNYKDIYDKYGFVMYCKRSDTSGEHRRTIKVLKNAAYFICDNNDTLKYAYIYSLVNNNRSYIDMIYITKYVNTDIDNSDDFLYDVYYKCKMLFGDDISCSDYINDSFFKINRDNMSTKEYYIS